MYSALLPVDRDTDRAFHQATYVARLADGGTPVEATVLYVAPPNRFDRPEDVEFATLEGAATAADRLEEAGVSVERVVDTGGVPQQIIGTADERDADEIVMGGRKRTGVTRVLLGSTVQDVVLSADRPVTVTGGTVTLGTGRRDVLVPVDRDVDRALAQARYVANLPNATEHVHATVCYVFPHQDYAGAPPHEFADVDAAVEAATYLDGEGVAVDRLSLGGEVVSKLLDTAEDLDVDGIVVGGRKRSGVQQILLGSTSLDTTLSAKRPVTITG